MCIQHKAKPITVLALRHPDVITCIQTQLNETFCIWFPQMFATMLINIYGYPMQNFIFTHTDVNYLPACLIIGIRIEFKQRGSLCKQYTIFVFLIDVHTAIPIVFSCLLLYARKPYQALNFLLQRFPWSSTVHVPSFKRHNFHRFHSMLGLPHPRKVIRRTGSMLIENLSENDWSLKIKLQNPESCQSTKIMYLENLYVYGILSQKHLCCKKRRGQESASYWAI